MTSERQVYVHIQLPGKLKTVPAGLLRIEKTNDSPPYVGRFRYGDRYLENRDVIALDEFHLPLGNSVYEFRILKGLPGVIRDASPDAWGRRVIEHKLGRGTAELEEIDYLIHGPQDGAGNLSFTPTLETSSAIRPYNRTHYLADLVAAAEAIEAGKQIPQRILEQIETGTSLGGARPKATIEDDNRLWLGKFPESRDKHNFQRIEFATLELARKCSLNVCHARLQGVGNKDVLMLERFDRHYTPEGYLRLGYASGFTLLDCDDHYLARDKWSYRLLADEISRWSAKPHDDRRELFCRMVFNAAVTNNDDHPRNHAMLRTEKGWRLSPAYDLIPSPVISLERRDLALSVGTYGRTASVYNLLSSCGRFRLTPEEARHHIDAIVAVVRGWREHFAACGVSKADIDWIAPAFLPECFFFEEPPASP